MRLVAAVSEVEPVYGTWVMLCALLSARGSEVNGLLVGDVDLIAGLVHIRRQVYPGSGGLVTKQTKGRAARTVPVWSRFGKSSTFAWTVGRPTRRLSVGRRAA